MIEKSLSTAFSDSLTEESMSCVSDLIEVGLDSIMEDGVLKDIPIVSTVIALYKIGGSILERHNYKKLVSFLYEINNGIVDDEKRKKYQLKFQSNDKFKNQEIEYLLLLINRYIGYERPKLLAKIYIAYLDETINWNEFVKYSEVIERLLPGDYQELKKQTWNEIKDRDVPDSLLRLVSLGLVVFSNKGAEIANTINTLSLPDSTVKNYEVTQFGNTFLDCLLNDYGN